jgi:hypothetical protein
VLKKLSVLLGVATGACVTAGAATEVEAGTASAVAGIETAKIPPGM